MPGLTVTAGGAAGVALGGALAVRGGPVPLRGALVPHRGVLAFLHRCQGTCGNTDRAVTRGQPEGKDPRGLSQLGNRDAGGKHPTGTEGKAPAQPSSISLGSVPCPLAEVAMSCSRCSLRCPLPEAPWGMGLAARGAHGCGVTCPHEGPQKWSPPPLSEVGHRGG